MLVISRSYRFGERKLDLRGMIKGYSKFIKRIEVEEIIFSVILDFGI